MRTFLNTHADSNAEHTDGNLFTDSLQYKHAFFQAFYLQSRCFNGFLADKDLARRSH